MDIWKHSMFSTGYGYPKPAVEQESDMDDDIRSEMFFSIF